MEEKIILKSRTSIIYLILLFIIPIFELIFCNLLFSTKNFWGYAVGIFLIVLYLLFLLQFIATSKQIIFYETYLEVKYQFYSRIDKINYGEIKKLRTEHEHFQGSVYRLPATMKSENDVVTVTTANGEKVVITEFRFDNYFMIRSLLQKIIRGEDLN